MRISSYIPHLLAAVFCLMLAAGAAAHDQTGPSDNCAGSGDKGTWIGNPNFCTGTGYPIVSVAATDDTASEPGAGSGGSGEFTISRDADAATTYDLTVYFEVEATFSETQPDSPPVPGDYFELTGEGVTFEPTGAAPWSGWALIPTGENEVVIEVVPQANYGGGTVDVVLTLVDDEDDHDVGPDPDPLQGKHYDLADTPAGDEDATVTITLNPPGTFTVALSSSTLPNDATSPVTVTVTRNGGPSGAVPVPIAFSGSAQEGVHYTLSGLSSNKEVSLAPSGSTTFQVSATGAVGGDRSLTITAGEVDHTEYAVPGIEPDSATLNIPDLTETTVVVTTASGPLLEGSSAHGMFTLRRPASLSANPLGVDVAVAGATEGTHFTFVDCSSPATQVTAPTTVTFEADRSRVDLCIRALDDGEPDPRKTVTLSIVPGGEYRVGSPSSASITVIDADLPEVLLRVIDTVARVDESGQEVSVGRFEVLRTPAALDEALRVSITLSGTAVRGTDYTINPGTTITIPAGATEATATVHAVSGAGFAGLRSVIVTLDDGPSQYTVVGEDEIVLTVASPAAEVPDDPEEEEEPSGAFVSGVTVQAVQNGVRVSWTAPLQADIQSFLVWRGDDLVTTVPYERSQSAYSYLDTEYPGGEHRYHVQFVLLGDTSAAFDSDNARASSFVTAPCGADVPDPESDFCKGLLAGDPNGEDPSGETERDGPPAWAMVLGAVLIAGLIAVVVVVIVQARK